MVAEYFGAGTASDAAFEQLLHRICRDFLELPTLRLTPAQAQRLWALDTRTCEAALKYLLQTHFLTLDAGQYARAPLSTCGQAG
jgi:hypothetical protein